ncbi:MAG: NAD(P)-dependent oxidoreductase [Chloroflexi bacterium]|nr:NAD(P)-dependent oxidoreductase [Chloroflexota bacterium]
MFERLVQAGYSLIAYDTNPQRLEYARSLGAASVGSPAELAGRCDTIITILPSSPIVESVVFGANGLLESMRPGSILIDMSSSLPSSTKKIAAALKERGINMLDAPISGGVTGARAGTLAIMVGGDAEFLAKHQPMLEAMGKNVFHCGDTAAGHAMKAMNNYLSATHMIATTEAAILATKMGLDPAKLIDVVNASSGRSWSSQFKFPNFVLPRTFNAGFTVGLMCKDLDIFTTMGKENGMPLFVANAVHQLWSYALSQNGAPEDHTTIVKFLEQWAGVEVQPADAGPDQSIPTSA